MCTAQQQRPIQPNGMFLLRLSRLGLVLMTLCICAQGARDAPNAQPNIVFPKSCIAHQPGSEQIQTLWQSIADHPTAGAYNTLGVLYAAADRIPCAIPAFESALGLDSQNWESHYNLALALLRKHDRTRAATELHLAIQYKPDSAAAHFALATLLKNAGKPAEAVEEFKRTLAIDPHQSDAAIRLAQIAMESGNPSAAIAGLEAALSLKPAPEQEEALQVTLATAYAQSGDRNSGLEILKTLIAAQPNSADAHFSLGEFYLAEPEPGGAVDAAAEYREALRLDSALDKARLSLGRALILLKKYPEAIFTLREYVAHQAKDENGFYALGLAYEGQNALREAAQSLRRAADLNPQNAATRNELGAVLTEQGHTAEAILQLQTATKLDPKRSETHLQLAQLFDKSGQQEAARLEHAKYAALRAREDKIQSAGKLNEEANQFLLAGNPKAAVDSYRKALQLSPADAKLHYNLSLALDKLSDQIAEREELMKAVQLDPNLSVAQNQLGLIALNSGKLGEAELRLKKALAINPEYPEAKSNLGVLYSRQGKTDDAEKLFLQAIQEDPKYAKAYVNLGLIRAQGGALAEAEQLFRTAIQLDPGNADAFTALGMLQAKTGRGQDAVKIFRKAVSLNPTSADAHLNLGIALVDQYDRPGGFQEFSEAARLNPRSSAVHYNLGRFYFETGKYGEARAELEQACQLQANFANALYFLALTEEQNNELERSTALFRKVVALEPENADAQYLLGQNFERLGKDTEAIEHWKAAVGSDPGHSQALYKLARALSKSHDPEARQYQARFDALQREQQVTDRVQQLGNFALEAANAQNWPQAMEQMSEAIQLCGNCLQAAHLHRNLGLFYARTGNIEGAEKELRRVLELNPGDSDAQKALAVLANARTARAK